MGDSGGERGSEWGIVGDSGEKGGIVGGERGSEWGIVGDSGEKGGRKGE